MTLITRCRRRPGNLATTWSSARRGGPTCPPSAESCVTPTATTQHRCRARCSNATSPTSSTCDRHAHLGVLIVAEVDGRLRGSGVFYPDASVQGLGWPPGWAGGRALAVHREARRHGVARGLIAECERLARTVCAPAFAFHTAPFMTNAISLYDGLGYRRAPRYDVDLGRIYNFPGSTEIRAIAYVKDLT